jgi:hypothetical protein
MLPQFPGYITKAYNAVINHKCRYNSIIANP